MRLADAHSLMERSLHVAKIKVAPIIREIHHFRTLFLFFHPMQFIIRKRKEYVFYST